MGEKNDAYRDLGVAGQLSPLGLIHMCEYMSYLILYNSHTHSYL
jgi:hypothetical protein